MAVEMRVRSRRPRLWSAVIGPALVACGPSPSVSEPEDSTSTAEATSDSGAPSFDLPSESQCSDFEGAWRISAVGDFDEDGRGDLLLDEIDEAGGVRRIALGWGGEGCAFELDPRWTVPLEFYDPWVGDLDDDGLDDLVLVDRGGYQGGVEHPVRFQSARARPSREFSPLRETAFPPSAVRLSGNGPPRAFRSVAHPGVTQLLLQAHGLDAVLYAFAVELDGSVTLIDSYLFPDACHVGPPDVGDFDGDGLDDLVVSAGWGGCNEFPVRIWPGSSQPALELEVPWGDIEQPGGYDVVDANGDGFDDLIRAGQSPDGPWEEHRAFFGSATGLGATPLVIDPNDLGLCSLGGGRSLEVDGDVPREVVYGVGAFFARDCTGLLSAGLARVELDPVRLVDWFDNPASLRTHHLDVGGDGIEELVWVEWMDGRTFIRVHAFDA